MSSKKLDKIRKHIKEIEYLKYTLNGLIYWDKLTHMPKGGLSYRSETTSYFGGLIYEKFSDKKFRYLIKLLEQEKSEDKIINGLIKRVKNNYFYINSIPADTYKSYLKLISISEKKWEEAKTDNNYYIFEPYLEQIVETFKIFAEHWGYEDNPYDALLCYYESGSNVKKVDEIISIIKTPILDILKSDKIDITELKKNFKNEVSFKDQSELSIQLMKNLFLILREED